MPPISQPPKSILITGASSGIGQALALHYARPGVQLFLSGRNLHRLMEVFTQCCHQGATAEMIQLDVTNKTAMKNWIEKCHAITPLDLVIANAGISAGTGDTYDSDSNQQILDINIQGVMNTLHPAITMMRERGVGQLAIISSLASFRGIPGAAAYCASKAAVRVYGEALRGELQGNNIGVSVICPGFVESRITDANDFHMPFLMTGRKAARLIADGLRQNKGRIAFPWPMRLGVWLLAALPIALTDRLIRNMPMKPPPKS